MLLRRNNKWYDFNNLHGMQLRSYSVQKKLVQEKNFRKKKA